MPSAVTLVVAWHADGKGKQGEDSNTTSAGREGQVPILGHPVCSPFSLTQSRVRPPPPGEFPHISAKWQGEQRWLLIVGFRDSFKVNSVLVEGTRQAEGRSREQDGGTKLLSPWLLHPTPKDKPVRVEGELQHLLSDGTELGGSTILAPSPPGSHFGGSPSSTAPPGLEE